MDFNIQVLVVDDFATMRNIVKTSLKNIGFKNIIEAEDGDIALGILRKQQIDLVLADWNMPNMKGLDLLKEIRKDVNLKNLPFIMVTAEGQKENVVEAVQAGVNSYIIKPFTPEILKDKIEKVFN
jgi:two-component system chemotaxis response regulator CheY